MFLVGDASEWFLPMPVSLVLVGLVFSVWKWGWPRARKSRFVVGSLIAVVFVVMSTPAMINVGIRWLEGTPRTVTEQLDALGVPPVPDGRRPLSDFAVPAAVLQKDPHASAVPEGAEPAAAAAVASASAAAAAEASQGAASETPYRKPDVQGLCIPADDVPLATRALPMDGSFRVQAVIVPSSGAPGPNGKYARLDQGGYMRLRAGIEAWRRSGGLLFLMGGVASAPEYALSTDMRRVALDMGVPDSAIRIVPMSRTTWEDIHGAVRIMREEGMDPKKGVLLVTSALHMHRSMATARSVGIDPVPLCSDYRQLDAPTWAAWFPNNGAPWNARAMLHELIGVWYYRLRGRA